MFAVASTWRRMALPIQIAVVYCAFVSGIQAEDFNPADYLRHLPPEGLRGDLVRDAAVTLRWQVECGDRQIELIQKEIDDLERQIDEHEFEIEMIVNRSPQPELAIAADENRDHLIGTTVQRLLEARMEIAAHEALIEHLGKQSQDATEQSSVSAVESAEVEAAKAKLKFLQKRTSDMAKLVDQGQGSTSVLYQSRTELAEAEAQLVRIQFEAKERARRRVADAMTPLAQARLRLHEVKAREQTSAAQLKQLIAAASIVRRVQKHEHAIKRLRQRQSLFDEQLGHVMMETGEKRSLLKRIEQRSNARPAEATKEPPAKNSESEKETEPDNEPDKAADTAPNPASKAE